MFHSKRSAILSNWFSLISLLINYLGLVDIWSTFTVEVCLHHTFTINRNGCCKNVVALFYLHFSLNCVAYPLSSFLYLQSCALITLRCSIEIAHPLTISLPSLVCSLALVIHPSTNPRGCMLQARMLSLCCCFLIIVVAYFQLNKIVPRFKRSLDTVRKKTSSIFGNFL